MTKLFSATSRYLIAGVAKLDGRSSLRQTLVLKKNVTSTARPIVPMIEIPSLLSVASFDVTTFFDDMLRVGLAILLGAIIGAERQLAGQSAGLRTHVMVAMGAAVFTLAGIATSGDNLYQVTRVVQGMATGVGFLGAGVILKLDDDPKVRGLTTAASIWVAAAMGASAGLGEYALAAAAAVASVVVLVVLRPLSLFLDRLYERNKNASGE
jgi:putative Mg2+ transporter-C (MgtC) family protein